VRAPPELVERAARYQLEVAQFLHGRLVGARWHFPPCRVRL